MHLQVSENN